MSKVPSNAVILLGCFTACKHICHKMLLTPLVVTWPECLGPCSIHAYISAPKIQTEFSVLLTPLLQRAPQRHGDRDFGFHAYLNSGSHGSWSPFLAISIEGSTEACREGFWAPCLPRNLTRLGNSEFPCVLEAQQQKGSAEAGRQGF